MALFEAFLALGVIEMLLFIWVSLIVGTAAFHFIGASIVVAPYALANEGKTWLTFRQAWSQEALLKIMLHEVFGVGKVEYFLNTGALRTVFVVCQLVTFYLMLLTL